MVMINVELVIFNDERVIESKYLVDKLIAVEKPIISRKKAGPKKGKHKEVPKVLTHIRLPPSFFP